MSFADKYNMSKEDNIFQAKRILVDSIYQEANLEGIAITFAETEDILNNVNVNSITPNEISKVCCLRDGWKYIFDNIDKPLDLIFLEDIHEIIARFDVDYRYLGKPRTEEVLISGTSWRPEIPNIDNFLMQFNKHLSIEGITERALLTGFGIMRSQFFKDGNKRVGSFAINKILIENGKGVFNVPVKKNGTFKQLLVDYYETNNPQNLMEWSYNECIVGVNAVKQVDTSLIGALNEKISEVNNSDGSNNRTHGKDDPTL